MLSDDLFARRRLGEVLRVEVAHVAVHKEVVKLLSYRHFLVMGRATRWLILAHACAEHVCEVALALVRLDVAHLHFGGRPTIVHLNEVKPTIPQVDLEAVSIVRRGGQVAVVLDRLLIHTLLFVTRRLARDLVLNRIVVAASVVGGDLRERCKQHLLGICGELLRQLFDRCHFLVVTALGTAVDERHDPVITHQQVLARAHGPEVDEHRP